VAALSTAAWADRIVLADGRTFTGAVSIEDETVTIRMSYGTLTFAKDKVLRIEFKDTPEAELGKRLAQTNQEDPDALFALAQWANQQDLKRHAEDIYARILKLAPDHGPTRRELGYVRVDGHWRTFDLAIELARSKLEAGLYDDLRRDLLPALKELAGDRARQLEVEELLAQAQLRAKEFAEAAGTYRRLSASAEGAAALRWTAIAEIIEESPDGMYVLTEAYPSEAGLLAGKRETLKPGPASLAHPLALQAALRERAKKQIEAGRKLLESAQAIEATDPATAKSRCALALKSFDRADALVPDIARTYRVEIARRQIASLRRDADANARRFDEQKEKLGRTDLTAQGYRGMVIRLIHCLDNVRDDLKNILQIAKPYAQDLVLEVKWAELDLDRIAAMRKVLAEELDG